MTRGRKILSGRSLSHQDASIDQLEACSFDSDTDGVSRLMEKPGVEEAFVLQTCNRVEAYVVTDEAGTGETALSTVMDETPQAVTETMGHEESLRHLLRVAAGLESLVLGEDQILGQVRNAYEEARQSGAIGPVLEQGVTKAIHVGERARTETAINEGVVSLASAAVRLAEEKHGLTDATAAVVGAGEMGRLAAKRLDERVDHLVLANRTLSRAETLAGNLDSENVRTTELDGLAATLSSADVVISATGSTDWILEPAGCRQLGETFLIDITRPRDIPPAADDEPELTVYDLDKLEAVTEKTRQMRREAAERVEQIVDEEFDQLLVQYKRKRADDVISTMYESAERIKARELETTFRKLDLEEESEQVVEAMADSLVSQLLAPPTDSLRDAAQDDDWTTIHTALTLFDPDLDDEDADKPSFVPDATTSLEDVPEEIRDQLPAGVFEDEE